LAHEAESLLSLVRSGHRALDTDVQELLIAATDALSDALAEPFEWQAAASMIEAMRAATRATDDDTSAESVFREADHEPWRLLSDDLEALRDFAEFLEEILPEIAQAVVNRDEDGLRAAIDALAFPCTRLGFDGL
jgi:chemotaxis protein histidine kinase CheA